MGIATTVVETTDVAKGRFTPEVREKDALYELVKLYHAIICNTIYGSVSAGRGKRLFRVLFFLKSRAFVLQNLTQ